MKTIKTKKNKAFTLIEMLVVVSIIGILIALGVASYRIAQQKSRDAKRKGDLEILRQALVLYRQDNGNYGNVNGSFADVVESLYDDDYLTDSQLVDPKNDDTYFYSLTCTTGDATACERVTLQVTLESDGETYEIRTP